MRCYNRWSYLRETMSTTRHLLEVPSHGSVDRKVDWLIRYYNDAIVQKALDKLSVNGIKNDKHNVS